MQRTTTLHHAKDHRIDDAGSYFTGTDVEATLQELGAKESISPINMHGNGGTVNASTGSIYLSPTQVGIGTSAGGYYKRIFATRACKLKNLYISTGSSQPVTGSLICTIQVEAADTALAVTIAAGDAAGVYSNAANEISINAGDKIILEFQNNASGASASINACAFEMVYPLE